MTHAHLTVSWKRLALAGVLVALAVLTAGGLLERSRLGPTPAETTARLVDDVARTLASRDAHLRTLVSRLVSQPALATALRDDPGRARSLFDLLERTGLNRLDDDTALTVYDADGVALAWSGRPSSLPVARADEGALLIVTPGPLGLRLAYVEAILEPAMTTGDGRRLGMVAAEQLLTLPAAVPARDARDFAVATPFGTVALVAPVGEEAPAGPVVLRGRHGEPLLAARVDPDDIVATKDRWRSHVLGLTAVVLAATLLLLGAPVAEWRRRDAARNFVRGGGLIFGLIVGVRLLLWGAVPLEWRSSGLIQLEGADPWTRLLVRSPLDFLITTVLLTGAVAVAATLVERHRLTMRERRRAPASSWRTAAAFTARQLVAGAGATALVATFEWHLRTVVDRATVDVMHLSLHPYDVPRLELLFGLVLLSAAFLGAAVLLLLWGMVGWRLRGGSAFVLVWLVACWMAPVGALVRLAAWTGWEAAPGPVLVTLSASAMLSLAWRRWEGWFRHGSRTRRLVVLVAMLVAPALLMYPSLADAADRAKRNLVVKRFAVETQAHPRMLLTLLNEALRQVDAQRLADLVQHAPVSERLDTEVAFRVWQQTSLADARVTSAVEVYTGNGQLASRFALNLPEYRPRAQRYRATSCSWEVFGEAAPFGAEERRMLHAERGVCSAQGTIVGALVLHVMLDYSSLSFTSSQIPYFEIFRGQRTALREEVPGSDVSLIVYGWGRTPVYTTSGRAWPLDDALFDRLYRSNVGFWTTLESAGAAQYVYFTNDRGGIYALGYPAPTAFDRGVHLAELATLGSVVAVCGLLVASLFQRLAWREPWTGRQLLREVRTSFSRKLFLAFVAATVIPVVILAVAIRAYVAGRLRLDVEAEAARTAAVAQRVIEETLMIERQAEVAASALDDDALVWLSRVIKQDINLYVGPQLVATSERDLFASGLLPTRVPDAVYRAIVIDRLASYVGEDEIAGSRYLMAAAPARAGDRDAVLTMPFTLRQREIEREIDELDRGVQLGALLFILLGAGIGYGMAERISDPVQRLTRASQRIAGGDLDTRVYVRSADELQRLVEAFNKMAWELQRQRAQLERTNRLEAWAEMAQQVAHDIKNPLTPIQLSAEHLRRVHRDRGEPLAPVLDSCIETILTQVRLLRQIAAEFSSFASTPSVRPVPTDVNILLEEVVNAYATGLGDRVAIVLDVAADLPQVQMDRTLIGRAVTNVVENALHAMAAGGTLTIRAAASEDTVTITVADTGIGMDEDSVDRIFEPYFSTKATGTGLGLTIAKRNVELHGGSIRLTSQRGVGTTVALVLPRLPPGTDAEGART